MLRTYKYFFIGRLNNYLKVASRNLLRNKLFSFISITGFTVGLTVFILLMTFVHNEMNYDSFHKNKDRIFRAVLFTPRHDARYGNFPLSLSRMMRESIPGIECAVNCLDNMSEIKINGSISKEMVTYTEPGFFRMFTFKTIAGNPYSFGSNPLSIFITEEFAQKHFGRNNPIGKTVSIKIDIEFYDFLVEGIVENPPANTSLQYSVLVPFVNAEKIWTIKFSKEDIHPNESLPSFFVMLKNQSDKAGVEAGFKRMIKPLVQKEPFYRPELSLYPIEKVHLSPEVRVYSSIETAEPVSILVLFILGIAILIVVSINYVNLTVAQSSHRFREIGIRKVAGAARYEIAFQFVAESFFIILISLLISIVLTVLILPWFNQVIGKNLSFAAGWGSILSGIIMLPVILSLLAGAYPALLVSGLNPVKIFKGTQKLSGSGVLAKVFVTTQFILAIVLISGAVIINSQYNFIMTAELGYNKDNVVLIRTNDFFGRRIKEEQLWLYKERILNIPGVISSASSGMVLGGNGHIQSGWFLDYGNTTIPAVKVSMDENMIPALNLKLLEGRNFSSAYPSDSLNSIIVNEELVKEAGIKNPVGKSIMFRGRKQKDVQIIGVVKNFHYRSLRDKVIPAAFFRANKKSWNECIYVKISPRNTLKTVAQLQKAWENLIPGQVFDYVFLDNKLADLYKNENRWKNIITYSSAVAILFACMGLFGLVFYQAEKRTKEIGIRKVLGASTLSIIRSLVNEFLILIAIAILIGCSLTYYFANKWLKDFAYHIELNAWIFILAALLVTAIVISTLLIIAFRVASANSVDNLRYE
ncbi:MAG: ABC transporter permease [Acidobacteriota bacterium]